MWSSMLLNNGRHPFTNKTIIPDDVIEYVSRGRTVADGGKPEYLELASHISFTPL